MEYMTEQFDLDMRKVSLYSKNAYIEYEFAVEEAFLESPEYVEYVVTEAAGNLIEKVRAVFKKIIESVKKFFSGLIEKVKSFFSNNKEEKLKKAVQANPALAKQKVEVPNLKEIEDVCGKRAMLRKKMIAEYKAGKLTRDRFDELVEQNEKLGKRLKTVGVVTLTIGTIVGGAFAASKLIPKIKKTSDDTVKVTDEIRTEEEKRVTDEVKTIHNSTVVNKSNPQPDKAKPIYNSDVAKKLNPQSDMDSRFEPSIERIKNDKASKKDTPKSTRKDAEFMLTVVPTKNTTKQQRVPRNRNKTSSNVHDGSKPILLSGPTAGTVKGTEVAQAVTKSITEEERETLQAQLKFYNAAIDKVQASRNKITEGFSGTMRERRKLTDEQDKALLHANQKLADDIEMGMSKKQAKRTYDDTVNTINAKYDPLLYKNMEDTERFQYLKKLRDKRLKDYQNKRTEIQEKLKS